MTQFFTLENLNNLVGVATPFILLIWFYYSQRQTFSKNYFSEIDGIYAGFTESISSAKVNKGVNSGIIMNIRDTDDKGYFKGEFDFGESTIEDINGRMAHNMLIDGIHTFTGKLNFEVYRDKARHPFKPEENRVYTGRLYIVDRLDFSFNDYKIETYLRAEYDIIHYREMQTMVFQISKVHRDIGTPLPQKFTLFKKMGASFEPYRNVKEVVFRGRTHSDV